MRGMFYWLSRAVAIGLGAGLLAAGAPLAAQDDASPSYDDLPPLKPVNPYAAVAKPRPAPRDKPLRIIVREERLAAEAEQACDAGDPAGCTALGKAYLYGAGRPQSRPIADILLREGCAADQAEACHDVGNLLVEAEDEAAYRYGLEALDRACRLGRLDACSDFADAIEVKDWQGRPGNPEAAEALRAETCARGGLSACIAQVLPSFFGGTDPAAQDVARARLDTLCSAGAAKACGLLIDKLVSGELPGAPPPPELRSLAERGCRADEADACRRLGRILWAEEAKLPTEQRGEALAMFLRACDLSAFQCTEEREIVLAPQLLAECAAGDQAQCASLGALYNDIKSVLHDPPTALRYLGGACNAGVTDACQPAAEVVLVKKAAVRRLAAEDIAAALHWSLAACEADAANCETLGNRLLEGTELPADRPKAYELLSRACEAEAGKACEKLAAVAEEDPEAPLPLASSDIRPPATEAERDAYYDVTRSPAVAAAKDSGCNITEALFRGQRYTDRICDRNTQILGGFDAKFGDAPYQAVIWRPRVLDKQPLDDSQRMLCGGSLVATGWVLTAAHCLVDKPFGDKGPQFPIDKHPYRIRLGLRGLGEDQGNSYPILRVIQHEGFRLDRLHFDIALVQYDPRAGSRGRGTFGAQAIEIDRLPSAVWPAVPGRAVYAYGWGVTDFKTKRMAEKLQGVKLILNGPLACTRSSKFTDPDVRDSVLCAAGPNGRQACNGDSGGPLVLDRGIGKRPLLVGVVSGGYECGTSKSKRPSQYTRIGHRAVQEFLEANLPGFAKRKPRQ